MDQPTVREARTQIARWIEEGVNVLGVLPGFFEQHERLRTAVESLETEAARLRRELHDAREAGAALREENDALRRERDDVAELLADGVNRLLNDALRRLRAPLPGRGRLTAERSAS
jgi:chromosome segregation ATPase